MTYEEHLNALDTNTVTADSQRFASYADIARMSHETGRRQGYDAAYRIVFARYEQLQAQAKVERDLDRAYALHTEMAALMGAIIALLGPVDR